MATIVNLPPMEGKPQDGDDTIVIADSLSDLVSHAKADNGWKDHTYGGAMSLYTKWATAGDTPDGIFDKALNGDMKVAQRAGKLLDKFNDDLEFDTHGWSTVDSVVGGSVNIGAYVAGAPMCMKQRRRVAMDVAPVAIVVDLGASSDCRHQEIDKRGVTVLALVQRLANVRPVQLYAATAHRSPDGGNIGTLTRLEMPIELATMGNALASTGFVRHICFGVENALREFGCGEKPWGSFSGYRRDGVKFWRRFTGEETLFIPSISSGDKLLEDSCGWVKEMLEKYAGKGQE
jgi:hypothetical protein